MRAWRAAALALVLLLSGLCLAQGGPSKCASCRAVAEELVARLDAEVPRNHLDLRHRLDKEGKRWGKVIDYKMSELRVIHLLEDLCDDMARNYQLVKEVALSGEAGERWVRTDADDLDRAFDMVSRKDLKERRRALDNFCADVLEVYEDDLSHALRNGEVDQETASDWLCRDTAKHCAASLAEEEAARREAEAAREAAEAEKKAAEEAAKAAAAEAAAAAGEGAAPEGAEGAEGAGEGSAAASGAGGDAMQEGEEAPRGEEL